MIIDTHVHIGTGLGFDMTEDQVLYSIDEYNIDYAIVSNTEVASHDHDRKLIPAEFQKPQIECLERTIKFARANIQKISIMHWVKPMENITPQLRNMIEDNLDIIKALKFHPYHAGCAFTSDECKKYIDLAAEYNLPVVSHTGTGYDDNPKRLFEMAKLYPKTPFVMVHLGLGSDNKEAIDLCSQRDNLYGDTTWVSTKSALEFINKCGDDRLMFGSDSPIDGKDTYLNNGKGDRSLYQEYFNEFKDEVSKETYDKIMYKNAARLFNIKL
ncbi:MAG: amidohydrolase family protein [Ruminococcus sp.]|nr:amidohydrolase family protein [Ruminococcus sp.]